MTKPVKGLRVLLLSPPYPHLGGEELFGQSGREEWFPLGVFTIANVIRITDTADVRIYYNPDYTSAKLETVIREYNPDLIGLTCYTNTRFACFELADLIKRINKNIKILLGGPHATFLDQQIMNHYSSVDMIIRGYAEEAFIEVIKFFSAKLSFEKIAGLTWRDGAGNIHRNCDRSLENSLIYELTPDIKSLFIDGLPTWKSMDMILFSLPIETSRGCVYTCSFCSRFGPGDRSLADREPAQALRHVYALFEIFGRFEVYFCDNNFTINRKRVFEFCDLLRAQPIKLDWTCSSRIDLVDREILTEMKSAGCRKIYYGVDSLCKWMLPSVGRNFTPEIAVKNLNLTVECGLETEGNIIIGLPGENKESVKETYAYRKQLHPDVNLTVRPLKIMPGAPMYQKVVKEGFNENYWLEDHGCEFPNYAGGMSEKEILQYCQIIKDPHKYLASSEKR